MTKLKSELLENNINHRINPQRLILNKISAVFPYVLLVLAVLGFGVAYKLSGIAYALSSLVFVIPIIFAAIILLLHRSQKACPNCGRQTFRTKDWACLWCGHPLSSKAYEKIDKTYKELRDERQLGVIPSESESEEATESELESAPALQVRGLSFIHFALVTTFLFIISIIILISFPTRSWVYFAVVALISGSIFVQILCKRSKWTDNLIMFEIVFLSLELIWGVNLKYPLYFGATDIPGHLFSIETILQTAHIEGLETYVDFPLFHIYNAIGVEITGLDLRTGLFVFMGISWEAGILFIYLLFKKISHSRMLPLTASLILAVSSTIIIYGTYAITRSLALVMILCWLYLILNKDNVKYIFFSLIMVSALILTHHTTILFYIPILIVIYISQRLFQKNKPAKSVITLLPIMVLTILFYSYMFYVASGFSSSIVARQINNILLLDTSSGIMSQPFSHYITGNIYDSLVLFFSVIGIGIALRQYASDNNNISFIIGFPSFFFLFFYFPNITKLLPNSTYLLLYRLPVLVSPFIMFMAAYGLSYFSQFGRNTGKPNPTMYLSILPVISVIMITFFSMMTPSNGGDVRYIQRSAEVGSTYFEKSELTAFSFMKQECDYDSVLYGDYETIRDKYDLPTYAFLDKEVITGGDISYIKEGYLVLRTSELQNSGGLSFSLEGSLDVWYRYHLSQLNSSTNILNNLSVKDRVYSNSDVQLFIINNK